MTEGSDHGARVGFGRKVKLTPPDAEALRRRDAGEALTEMRDSTTSASTIRGYQQNGPDERNGAAHQCRAAPAE